MIRCIVAAVFCLICGPLMAQDGVFRDYEHLRSTLDPQMKSREIANVLKQFGGSDEMTPEQLRSLGERMRTYYKKDFDEVALIKRVELANGWRQELLAYWTGYSYVYVYMLLHQRDDEIVSVHFKFNSDFDEVNASM